MLTVVQEGSSGEEPGRPGSLIDEIVREGARRMLAEALQAEVDAYIAAFAGERDENGRRLVVRNGYRRAAEVLTSAGAVEVTAPRVNDKRTDPADRGAEAVLLGDLAAVGAQDPEDHRGAAAALPAWTVYRGLRARAGPVPGLLGRAVGGGDHRLTEQWKAEQRAFAERDMSGADYVYLLSRRDPRAHPIGRAQAVPAGHDRRAHRRPQRSSSPWLTATASPRSRGLTCSVMRPAAKCAPRCWPPATARWDSGARCARSSPRPGNSAV